MEPQLKGNVIFAGSVKEIITNAHFQCLFLNTTAVHKQLNINVIHAL